MGLGGQETKEQPRPTKFTKYKDFEEQYIRSWTHMVHTEFEFSQSNGSDPGAIHDSKPGDKVLDG